MELDYFEPGFRLSQAALAAGFEQNTLRSNFQRQWFRSFATKDRPGRGRAKRLCLADVVVLAITRRFIDLGLHPAEAFKAAFPFGLVSKIRKGQPARPPCTAFDPRRFDTVLVWRPGGAEVMPIPKGEGVQLDALGLTGGTGDAVICLMVNDIEANVMSKLGLPSLGDPRA